MIRRRIGETTIRRGVVCSTMDEARFLAEAGAAEGTVVVANHQMAGRGRAGRHWIEQPGDALLLSVILRPDLPGTRLSLLPLLIGVAVAEALEAVAPICCQLKWPNDVWIDGRKVAGILLTTHHGDGEQTVIAGVGINVDTPVERLPDGATSLAVASGTHLDREAVLDAVINRVDGSYGRFVDSGGSVDLAGWWRRAALVGETVQVVQGEQMLTGLYRGIDDDGALVLEGPGRERRRVAAGDLVRGPRPVR